jgi:hypothetical protein
MHSTHYRTSTMGQCVVYVALYPVHHRDTVRENLIVALQYIVSRWLWDTPRQLSGVDCRVSAQTHFVASNFAVPNFWAANCKVFQTLRKVSAHAALRRVLFAGPVSSAFCIGSIGAGTGATVANTAGYTSGTGRERSTCT